MYTICYSILLNVCALVIFLVPLWEKNKFSLPFKVWTPYNINCTASFLLSYIHQGITIALSACVNSSVESLALMIIMQICAQYEILIHRMNLLPQLPTKNYNKAQIHQFELTAIKDCVQHHIHIFSIGDKLNELFGSVIFVQFFSSMIILCLITYQLTKLSLNDPSCWTLGFLLISALVQILLYNAFGEKLLSKSISLMDCIYKMQWLSTTNKTKRDLIFIMIRSSKPITFKGNKLVVMSIQTFVQIVKSAYSAYNLLSNF